MIKKIGRFIRIIFQIKQFFFTAAIVVIVFIALRYKAYPAQLSVAVFHIFHRPVLSPIHCKYRFARQSLRIRTGNSRHVQNSRKNIIDIYKSGILTSGF